MAGSGLTNSQRVQGLVAFSSQLPNFFLPPFAGVLTDRVNRRSLLLVTQSLAMLQAFGLVVLVWSGHVRIWQLVLFNFSFSAINAFNTTARQTSSEKCSMTATISPMPLPELGDGEWAPAIGPSLAALAVATAGVEGCFFVNGISFLAVLVALLARRLPPRVTQEHHTPIWRGIATDSRTRSAMLRFGWCSYL